MKRQLQETLAALESAEADTRDGASRFIGVLHLVGNDSAPELSDLMGDDCGEDFDFHFHSRLISHNHSIKKRQNTFILYMRSDYAYAAQGQTNDTTN